MIKDIVVNLSVGEKASPACDYAVSVAAAFDAHLAGIAFLYDPIVPVSGAGYIPADVIEAQERDNEEATRTALDRFNAAEYDVGKFRDARPLQGDATCLPVRDGVADVVALSSVTHHLTDPQLDSVFSEAARVLRPGGVLFVCDAVWSPSHRAGRLLWRYDRGSHPRTTEQIDAALTRTFRVVQKSEFSVVHAFAAFLCRPVNAP